MNPYSLRPGGGIDALDIVDGAEQALRSNDVRVSIAAAALNYRDILMACGQCEAGDAETVQVVARLTGLSGRNAGGRGANRQAAVTGPMRRTAITGRTVRTTPLDSRPEQENET